MYYFKRIGIIFKNDLFTLIFSIIWILLKILKNHYFHLLFHACHEVQFKKNLTNQNRKDISGWRIWQHSPEWQNHRKEGKICFKNFAAFSWMIKIQEIKTSDWKNWFHYIKWQKHKIRTHCCLQKLAPF